MSLVESLLYVVIVNDTKDTKDTKGTKDTKDTGDTNGRRWLRPNEASRVVIACALKVHSALGAGMLESAICAC